MAFQKASALMAASAFIKHCGTLFQGQGNKQRRGVDAMESFGENCSRDQPLLKDWRGARIKDLLEREYEKVTRVALPSGGTKEQASP